MDEIHLALVVLALCGLFYSGCERIAHHFKKPKKRRRIIIRDGVRMPTLKQVAEIQRRGLKWKN